MNGEMNKVSVRTSWTTGKSNEWKCWGCLLERRERRESVCLAEIKQPAGFISCRRRTVSVSLLWFKMFADSRRPLLSSQRLLTEQQLLFFTAFSLRRVIDRNVSHTVFLFPHSLPVQQESLFSCWFHPQLPLWTFISSASSRTRDYRHTAALTDALFYLTSSIQQFKLLWLMSECVSGHFHPVLIE